MENELDIGNTFKDKLMLPPTLEHEWREELQHRFLNVRLNTLKEIRRLKMKGAELILYESLDQPKLWLRMEALFGLAEQGIKFDHTVAQRALADSRVSLQKNYFKRFKRKLTEPELYVHRQTLKVASGPVRVELLKNLLVNQGVENHIFVQAARFDVDLDVTDWFNKSIGQNSLLSGSLAAYRKAIEDGYNKQLTARGDEKTDYEAELGLINESVANDSESLSYDKVPVEKVNETEEINETMDAMANDGFDSLQDNTEETTNVDSFDDMSSGNEEDDEIYEE